MKTDHILFIASGAFHLAKPSDLLPELQGRLPIRVELNALTNDDFRRILREPKASLIKQYVALMATEGVKLDFTEDAIDALADIAVQVNSNVENIGARRLSTVLERVLDDISFDASDRPNETFTIDAAYVQKHIGDLAKNADLASFCKGSASRQPARGVMRLIFLSVLLVLFAVPLRAEPVSFLGDDVSLKGEIIKPDGPGPFPAVVAMHGCGGLYNKHGGLSKRHQDWAERLAQAGSSCSFPTVSDRAAWNSNAAPAAARPALRMSASATRWRRAPICKPAPT